MKCIVAILAVIGSVASAEMLSGRVTTDSNIWRLNYTIDTTTSMFHATVRCRTNGWIGMGLSYAGPSGHASADSMVAFHANGTHHIHDQFSKDHSQPVLDVTLGGKEDLTITGWREGNGTHSVTFMRALNTNDGDRDVVIENKPIYVSWACGNDVPILQSDGTIDYKMHPDGQFGAVQVNLFSNPIPSTQPPLQSGGMSSGGGISSGGSTTTTAKSTADSVSPWLAFATAAILAIAIFF